jgi:hypothetical protein
MRVVSLGFFFLFLISSCGQSSQGDGTDTSKSKLSETGTIVTGSAWRNLTESWSASLNLKNASIMKSFYADSVAYYGDRISSEDVVKRQAAYFSENTDYKQKIFEYVEEVQQPDGSWLVRIMKQVRAGGNVANYPSSLVFANQNGIWKIVAESDDITDINKSISHPVELNKEIEIIGLLEETTGFVLVDGGDSKSDGRTPYFVIWPKTPLQVAGDTTTLDHVQVIATGKDLKSYLNKRVRVSGKLFAKTEQTHFTAAILKIETIDIIK